MLLDVHEHVVQAEVQIPLAELGLALKTDLPETTAGLSRYSEQLESYLPQHIQPLTPDGQPWTVQVDSLRVEEAEQTAAAPLQELVAQLTFTPPAGASTRVFSLHYDAVIHQVVTHTALVSVRQDWAGGVTAEHPAEVGVIRFSPVDSTVPPLNVDRSGASVWGGFVSMVKLGVSHIAAGTDHLLFLLTLLLPASLLVTAGRWGQFKGTRRSLLSILKIVSAFTVGHSLTLILGTLFRLELPAQPIEVLIALSIFVSAVHALRPIFPRREMLIAGAFGLVHGMAFSFTLAELNLSAPQMALTLLGFNLGIEAMQLFIIAVTMPWLILLARTPVYTPVRVIGGSVAALAATGWFAERLGYANPLSVFANGLGAYGLWGIAGLAGLAVTTLVVQGVGRKERIVARP